VKTIQLTRGKVATVDDIDFERLSAFSWQAHTHKGKWYARSNWRRDTVYGSTLMHRLILDAPDSVEVDHINGDGLDNRRENLRLCSHAQNSRNRAKIPGRSSRFKGVSLHKPNGRWRSRIMMEGRMVCLGNYATEQEAAAAYDAAATSLHGEFASTNRKA